MSSPNQNKTARQVNDSSFLCGICLDVPRAPVVSMCGHLFCWPCIHQWIEISPGNYVCPVCNAKISKDGFVPIYGNGSDYGNGNGNGCANGNPSGNGYENSIPNGCGYNNGYMNTNGSSYANGNGNRYGYGSGDGNCGCVNGNGNVNSYENQMPYRHNTSGNGNRYECENTHYPNYSWGDGHGIRSANENRSNNNECSNRNERRNENGFGNNNTCNNGNRHENGNEAGCSNRSNNENRNGYTCMYAEIHGDSNNNICRNENENSNVHINNGSGDRYTRREESNGNIPPRPCGQRYPTSSNQTSERDCTSSNTNTTNTSCEGIPVVFTYGLYGYDQSKQNQPGCTSYPAYGMGTSPFYYPPPGYWDPRWNNYAWYFKGNDDDDSDSEDSDKENHHRH